MPLDPSKRKQWTFILIETASTKPRTHKPTDSHFYAKRTTRYNGIWFQQEGHRSCSYKILQSWGYNGFRLQKQERAQIRSKLHCKARRKSRVQSCTEIRLKSNKTHRDKFAHRKKDFWWATRIWWKSHTERISIGKLSIFTVLILFLTNDWLWQSSFPFNGL